MRIRHLFEDYDEELFWESMQDHGWKPDGKFLVSPDDKRITVSRNKRMHYRRIDTQFGYNDADYAELLRFGSDPEVQAMWCSWNHKLSRFASEVAQLAIVRRDWFAIRYIKNPSEAVQLAAVQRSGHAMQYIKNPSETVKLAAVRQNGHAIYSIKNPSEAVQLAAVRENGYAIEYIEDPSEAVQLAAVRENGYAIANIKNPSEAVKRAALR